MTIDNEFRAHDSINDRYLWGLLEHCRSIVVRARELELAKYGISIEQMSVMHALLIHGGSTTLEDISKITVRQYNSVSTLVNRMCAAGLITKEKMENQKKFKITLTEKARKITNTVPHKSIDQIFSSLDTADKEILATCLEQLIITGREYVGLNYIPPVLSELD
jgi:DNA-binding MarR family transcriptional regulator